MSLRVNDARGMEQLGAAVAGVLQGGEIIFLQGDLGAGKTTLVRGLLHGMGYQGNVKSPTYTLVEEYELAGKHIFHFDLYRLNDPEELEDMGIRDYCEQNSICLFEWPERGAGVLPGADLAIAIEHADTARHVRLEAASETGTALISGLQLAEQDGG